MSLLNNPVDGTPPPTVLLAEDERLVREVMVQMLEALGYRVLAAEDGNRAMQLFSDCRGDVDLVIFDLAMPEMDGGELFTRLRHLNPRVKTLLTTGHHEVSQVQRMRAEGLNGFLPKPFTLDEMRLAVTEVMGGSPLAQAESAAS